MERFYTVPKETDLYKETVDFNKSVKEVNNFAKQFFLENGIETTEYCGWANALFIIPTENDRDKFKKQLTVKPYKDGLRRFKANSKISRTWVDGLNEKGIAVKYKPLVGMYFDSCMGARSRLFFSRGVLYCSYECNCDFKDPDGFIPMNGSDFYKVIEDIERDKEDGNEPN